MSNEFDSLFREVANGNEEAFQYLKLMSKVFRVWDDLWDQDKDINPEVADNVFQSLTFDLSRNKFFQEHRQVLEAFVFVAWNAWRDSNEWQGHADKVKGVYAWFLRDYCNEIDTLVAWLVGGTEHARKMSLKCRNIYLTRLVANGLDGFVKE